MPNSINKIILGASKYSVLLVQQEVDVLFECFTATLFKILCLYCYCCSVIVNPGIDLFGHKSIIHDAKIKN